MMDFIIQNRYFYISIHILHFLTAIFFIATVYFRTFVMMPFRKKIPEFELLNMLVYKRARKIMVIDVSFLLLSGLCLLFYYKESIGIFGIIKIILGILAILMFYFAPKIIKKFEKINGITPLVHYLLFGLQISIVVLAKIMFF